MQQQFDDLGSPLSSQPARRGGFNARSALLGFAFATFVLGGFSFGWLFLANWRLLVSFQSAQVKLGPTGPSIMLPNMPELEAARRNPPPGIAVPPVPAATAVAEKPEDPRDALNDLPEWKGVKRVNILLLGIDHREDEPIDGSRSDTIMVASIDPPSKSAVLISLPRDLWVNIPGFYNQRINVAHAVGGPATVARTIEANFGIKIDNYARVDFRGFEQVVDAVGGVIVDVERPVKDDEYPTEDYGTMRLFIPPGPLLMDGKAALMYARSRHSEDDFGRARRQQRVLVALRERALQLNVVTKIPTLLGIAQKSVSTDLDAGAMISLGRLGLEIERDRIKTLVVDASLAQPFLGPNGENLLMPSRAEIQRAILRAFSEAAGQTARVEVLNGTTQVGVARQLADQLASAGYEVTRVDDADRTDYQQTTLEVLNGNQRAAAILAARLKLPPTAIKSVPTPGALADVRVIVGASLPRP